LRTTAGRHPAIAGKYLAVPLDEKPDVATIELVCMVRQLTMRGAGDKV
jgi:hypothetical protein